METWIDTIRIIIRRERWREGTGWEQKLDMGPHRSTNPSSFIVRLLADRPSSMEKQSEPSEFGAEGDKYDRSCGSHYLKKIHDALWVI